MKMDCLLSTQSINKVFPGVKALEGVSIDVRPGEVHALIGENGAGKSTLMKILNGIYQPDGGTIYIKGKEVSIDNPHRAQELGISIVFQEFNLCDHISIANNIFIGRMHTRFGMVDDKWLYAESKKLLDRIGLKRNPRERVRELSVAEKQMVEIAKALSLNADVIVFDEPTSSLTEKEIEQLFAIIKKLREDGKGIFYISHRLEELESIADRVTVLRDGQHIATYNYADVTIDLLVRQMVGRCLTEKFPEHTRKIGETYFTVKNIRRKGFVDVDGFSLRRGEILGVAGLVGAGRTETMRAIFGADRVDAPMEIALNGNPVVVHSPKQAINNGIAYLTEDRKGNGLALTMDVERNINMASHREIAKHYVINTKRAYKNARRFIKDLNIKTPNMFQRTQFLSGGNQQKVVLSRWLCRQCKVLIVDEPTRGIDVGAKYEIYKLMNSLSDQGIGIIMISSELPEILGVSDRILVFCKGKIAAVLDKGEATQELILEYAAGLHSA
jgi:ribose transport system ATP-binding protein